MNVISAKELLVVGVAVAITACLLTPHKPVALPNLALGQHSYDWSRAPGEPIGGRSPPSTEPCDLFGLRHNEQHHDDGGGRSLPNEGR